MPTLKQKQETFSFVMGVSGIDVSNPSYADLLFEAGCSDGLVFLENGKLFVEFDREAESYESALASAEADINKAGGTVAFSERVPS
jgi:hypothetical protein